MAATGENVTVTVHVPFTAKPVVFVEQLPAPLLVRANTLLGLVGSVIVGATVLAAVPLLVRVNVVGPTLDPSAILPKAPGDGDQLNTGTVLVEA